MSNYDMVLQEIINRSPRCETETIKDGKKVCSVCGEYTEKEYKGYKVPRMCLCQRSKVRERQEKQEAEAIEVRRKECFGSSSSHLNERFEYSKDQGKAFKTCYGYAKAFNVKRMKSGLLLWGGVGTGKSYLASCIANYEIDKGYTVRFFNVVDLANKMRFSEDEDVLKLVERPALLILDDLGAERNTEWMQEKIFQIIEARLSQDKPMIITTNIPLTQFVSEDDQQKQRIYNRVLKACDPLEINGESWRVRELKERFKNNMRMYEEYGNED